MGTRRPSLQFYTADWQANPKLRRCSHAEKGVWLDVICILHDQDEYGVVRWPLKDLALAVHTRISLLQGLVDKGILKGSDSGECEPFIFVPRHSRKDGEPVTLIKSQPGPIWYSSRMVHDEYVREARADAAPNPAPKGGIGARLGADQRPHPSRERASAAVSSSSSSSSSGKKEEEEKRERPAKPRDDRVDHPALQAVREIRGQYPAKDVWDLIIKTVGMEPDVGRMRECWLAWRGKDFRPNNLGWLTDWYVSGIPGGNNGKNRSESSSERNARNLRENAAYIRGIPDSDSETDREDPIGFLTPGV